MSGSPEYHINQELYASANSLIYRARRAADDRPVILKILNQEYPSPERIAWFKREYEVIRNLNMPGVVAAYDLEDDRQRWMMVLEDFGGDAREQYDQASALAQLHGYLNEETLAHELAGRFYLSRGHAQFAQVCMHNAHYAYRRWGALAKTRDLEARYPQCFVQSPAQMTTGTTARIGTGVGGARPGALS